MDRRAETVLVNSAVDMAVSSTELATGTILHSDQRPQFTSWGYTQNVACYGILTSMGTVGDCYDNAMMESFWARLQTELLNTKKWMTIVELSTAIADYIENFSNVTRRHSALKIRTPSEFESMLPTTSKL